MNSATYADTRGMLARLAVVLLAVTVCACAARGGGTAAVPRPFPGAPLPPVENPTAPAPEPPTSADMTTPPGRLVSTALDFLGIPYRNGGSDPTGFDCSGFVQYVFAMHGTPLPREVREQYHAGREVELEDVEPGDLVFFETVSRGASHVGIALGEGRFVHAPSSRGVVRVEPYTGSYWARRFVGARRVEAATTD